MTPESGIGGAGEKEYISFPNSDQLFPRFTHVNEDRPLLVTTYHFHCALLPTGRRSIGMRVQASLQFFCATTGRNLETQLSTETRNLGTLRRGNVPMRCAFCGRQHLWRLIEYHRLDTEHQPGGAPRDTVHAEKKTAGNGLGTAVGKDCLGERHGRRRRRQTGVPRDKQEAVNM